MAKWRDIYADCRGQVTIEYTLLLATFGIPMIIGFRYLLGTLAEYWKMITFLETLPFP